MSDIDKTLYELLSLCYAAAMPLSNDLFAQGMATKYELQAQLRARLAQWQANAESKGHDA